MAMPSQPTAKSKADALAAFYQKRSEALRDSHTTTDGTPSGTPQTAKPTQTDDRSWYQKLMDALSGK